jgi:hypothetical protein
MALAEDQRALLKATLTRDVGALGPNRLVGRAFAVKARPA